MENQSYLFNDLLLVLKNNLKENFSNRKNGYTSKTIKSSISNFELETPRDRNNTFIPQIVKKNQTMLTEELDDKILSIKIRGQIRRS